MKLQEVYDEWLMQKKRQVKPTTLCVYMLSWRRHIAPQWADADIATIGRSSVRPWVYSLLDSGLSMRRVQNILTPFRMMLKYAADEMECDVKSLEWRIVWPTCNRTGGKRMVDVYQSDVAEKVIADVLACPEPRRVALLIAFCSGMRIGEVCGLRWGDIDVDREVFRVRRTVSRIYDADTGSTRFEIGTTKTASGTREIPIVRNILPLMKRLVSRHDGGSYVGSDSTTPMEPRSLSDWTSRYLKRLGVKQVLKFHAIRHTFATRLIDGGADIKSVSAIMGHSNVTTTMNLYVHPSAESKSRAINKIISRQFK